MARVRKTIQQKLILEAVCALHNHPSIDQVYEQVRGIYPNIGKATVYRNLLQLAEEGRIRAVILPVSPIRYDGRVSPHYHFRCRRCGEILDVETDTGYFFKDGIRAPNGVLIETHELAFSGLCARCNSIKE